MKKLYGIMGLAGFILIIGAAGGADNTDFSTTVVLMLTGVAMLCLSPLLTRIHIRYRKYRRIVRRKNSAGISFYKALNVIEREDTRKVSQHIKSLELC